MKHFKFNFSLPTGEVVANVAAQEKEISIKGALNNALKHTEVRIKDVCRSSSGDSFYASWYWKKGAANDAPSITYGEDLGQIFLDEGDYK
jgi:hypothetical protein